MEDGIFEEIDEDLQRDRLIRIWKDYGNYIVLLLVVVVCGITGYSMWSKYNQKQLTKATIELSRILSDSKFNVESLKEIEAHFPKKVAALSVIIRCGSQLKNGTSEIKNEAIKRLKALSGNSTIEVIWRDLATLIITENEVSQISAAELIKQLEPLTVATRPFRLQATELIGHIALKFGDKERAKAAFEQIKADKLSSQSMKVRAELILSGPDLCS